MFFFRMQKCQNDPALTEKVHMYIAFIKDILLPHSLVSGVSYIAAVVAAV